MGRAQFLEVGAIVLDLLAGLPAGAASAEVIQLTAFRRCQPDEGNDDPPPSAA